jgi:CPW-WPC domain-containing protein
MSSPLLAAALCFALGKPAASWDGGPLTRASRIQSEELDDLSAKAQAAASSTRTTLAELVPGATCACTGRVYSASCPAGWAEDSIGQCQPPADYKGLCSKVLSFTGEPTKVKMEAEGVCAICWPCP